MSRGISSPETEYIRRICHLHIIILANRSSEPIKTINLKPNPNTHHPYQRQHQTATLSSPLTLSFPSQKNPNDSLQALQLHRLQENLTVLVPKTTRKCRGGSLNFLRLLPAFIVFFYADVQRRIFGKRGEGNGRQGFC